MKNKFSIAMSLAVILAMLVTAVALADSITNDVVSVPASITLIAGDSTSFVDVQFWIQPNSSDGDPQCNFDTNPTITESLTFTVNTPSGVTADPAELTFTKCKDGGILNAKTVRFSANASASSGNISFNETANNTGGTFNYSAAVFYVSVTAPIDTTAPVITKTITGTIGNDGWYTSNVVVDWTVSDSESSFTTVGCVDTTINSDTAGTPLACEATSMGGTSSDSVTIKRDATAPINVSGAPNRSDDSGTWYNHAVDVVFTGTDVTSGIASCTTSNYSGPDGAGVSVNGSCTDNAGNTSTSVASSTFNYDGSGPTGVILSVTAGTPGSNGWYTSDVTIHTSSETDISGVTCTPDQFQGEETAGAPFNGSCTNGAGLSTAASPLVVKLDETGPSAVLSAIGTLGTNGWYVSDVTVQTTGTDSISNPTTCTTNQSQTTDTAGQDFNGSCTNDAGLSTNAATLTVKRDTTAPSASASRAPDANANGWNNTDVTVSFNGTDGLSGIDFCDAAVILNAEGADQSASGTCTDRAGNVSAPAMLGGINIDKTAPTASASALPAPNANGWNNTDVTVSFSGTDGLSGLDSCTADVILSTEGAGQSASGTCTDKASNVSTPASASANIDKTAPLVSLVGGPANSGTYYFGFVPAPPTCSATDDLSGLDGACSVDGYSNAVGSHTVTASATDKAGNSASASASYTVNKWTLNGFNQPVDMNVLNNVKGGSTVPLKFEVFAGPMELTSTSIISAFTQRVSCTAGTSDDIEQYATGGTSLRYDTTGGQFIFNWQTPKQPGACYRVTLTTQDGSSIAADFKLK